MIPGQLVYESKSGGRFEDQLVFEPVVIQKLDMLKSIKEHSIEEQDFEKALACKKQIELVTRLGTNLKEVFNSRL